MRNGFFGLIVSFLLISVIFGAPAHAKVPETVVIVDRPSADSVADPDHLTSALSLALPSYLDYSFSLTGQPYTLFRTDQPGQADQLVDSLVQNGNREILIVQGGGRLIETPVDRYTRSRRRYVVHVRDQLDLKLRYQIITVDEKGSRRVSRGCVHEYPKRPWLLLPYADQSREADSLIAVTPEPFAFIISRAVDRLVGKLKLSHVVNCTDTLSADTLSPAITVAAEESSTLTGTQCTDEQIAAAIIRNCSRSLYRATGYRLQQNEETDAKQVVRTANGVKFSGRGDADVVLRFLSSGKRLSVFQNRDFEAIGLSQRGNPQVLVRLIHAPRPEVADWQAFLNSRTLLHEIGHRYGAIHVSDPTSVMNHNATWLAPDRFDPLNKQIIKEALAGRVDITDAVAYARLLADLLDESDYALADFPPVFADLLPQLQGKAGADRKRHRKRINPGYLTAGRAFAVMRSGNLADAAKFWREAIREVPNEAACYYYLSKCVPGAEAGQALATAARLGYSLARTDSQRSAN